MPKMVDLMPSEAFEAKNEADKATFAEIVKRGTIRGVAHVSAMESIKASRGMYAIAPEATEAAPAAPAPKTPTFEEMDLEQIKTLLLLQGVKVKAGISKEDAIADLRKAIE